MEEKYGEKENYLFHIWDDHVIRRVSEIVGEKIIKNVFHIYLLFPLLLLTLF